jgi:hypothetical protein
VVAEVSTLEYHGSVLVDGVQYVNILDTTTRKSRWLALNRSVPDCNYTVVERTGTNQEDFVTLEQAGKRIRLPMTRSKVLRQAAPAMVAAPVSSLGIAQTVRPSGPVVPSSGVALPPPQRPANTVASSPEETKRLEDFHADLQRRKQERQQALATAQAAATAQGQAQKK